MYAVNIDETDKMLVSANVLDCVYLMRRTGGARDASVLLDVIAEMSDILPVRWTRGVPLWLTLITRAAKIDWCPLP